jgi:hypothetical protein
MRRSARLLLLLLLLLLVTRVPPAALGSAFSRTSHRSSCSGLRTEQAENESEAGRFHQFGLLLVSAWVAVQERVDRILANAGTGMAAADAIHFAEIDYKRRHLGGCLIAVGVIVERSDFTIEKASQPRNHS